MSSKMNQEPKGAKGRLKHIKNATSLPLLEIDNPESIGVDRWQQVDFLSPGETNLLVAAGLAEHPTKSI